MSGLRAAAVCAAAVGLAGGGLVYASAWPGSQLFGATLIAGRDPLEIALTFDDGPNDAATRQLLEVLARHGVRATFFVIGRYARALPEIVREMIAAGHAVGNHTMDHPRLSIQSAARVRRELVDCNAALEDITGTAVRFFRPPFGARRPVVLRAARELGLQPVMWNVTGYDWKPMGAAGVLRNLEAGIARNRRRQRGSNLLLHDGGHMAMGSPRMDTVAAVDRLLTAHHGTSTRFVRVEEWCAAGAASASAAAASASAPIP